MNIRLINNEYAILHNDFLSECDDCISACDRLTIKMTCPIYKDTRRIGKKKNEMGEVFGCSSNKDLVNSSKSFNLKVESIFYGLKEIENIREKINLESMRLQHNLTKTNAHNIQELYALVPQEVLSQSLNSQLKIIERKIEKNPLEVAKTFLRIAKNNAAMKVEFTVFNKVFSGKTTANKRKHQIKKVVLSLFHIFFQDFSEKNVYVSFSDNEDYLIFDYELLHVALYHIIDNATKYTLPGSNLNVNFKAEENDFYLEFEMISLKIYDNELLQIFNDGFSGKQATKSKQSGKGLGLSTTKKLLSFNDAELIINNKDISMNTKFGDLQYAKNVFIIKFNNYLQQNIGATSLL